MGLPHLSVRRPVTAMMICVGAVLLGIISWLRLPQELFPPITYPQISIVTFYKDAAPEEIEILITKLIEEQVGTVSGVRRISSTSEEERSLVIAEFNWDTHMDFAALNVREKIDLVKERLPRGSDDSIVVKYNPFELPVMVLNVIGNLSPQDLLHMTRKVVKSEIEKVEGVAAATLSGGVEREILVELDQGRLIATGTSVTNVVDALANANLNYPAGTIKETFYEQLIRTIGEFGLVEEVGELSVSVDEGKSPFEPDLYEGLSEEKADVLREENKKLILIKDVGKVYDTTKERTSISRHNGLENISISIQKKATANTVKTCDRIREVILALREDLSKDIRISIAYDQSEFVRQSLNGVMTSGLQGGVLAFLVLLVFLRSIRAAAVVAITIPVSVLITFSGMYFFGVTLNIISLGGLALGIGMLVDNGIVVIENIIRKQQEKKLSDVASIQGASEVSGAITSSTLTTVTVFVPMIFVIGIAGQLFKELAFTVIFSLAASLGVALIFIPPVMRKMLDHEKGNQASGSQETRFWTDVQAFFSKTLALFLRFKFLGVLFALVLFMFSLYVSRFLDREFLPRVDQGQFVLKVDMLPGTKLEITDSITTLIESKLSIMPEISDVTVNIGSAREKGAGNLLETLDEHQAQILVSLVPKADRWRSAREGERTRSTQEVIQELKKALQTEHLLGAEIEYVAQESVFQSALVAGKPIVVEITGSELAILERLAKEMQEKLEQIRGVYGVKSSQSPGSPETKVHILKDRASAYRLSTSDIALTAQTAIKGYTATEYKEEGREIDLLVRLREEDRDSLNKVRNLTIHWGWTCLSQRLPILRLGRGQRILSARRNNGSSLCLQTSTVELCRV
jgi:hydrophobic/amphiphilic exporter-1 (mainly G- bacteria), HAE1 family